MRTRQLLRAEHHSWSRGTNVKSTQVSPNARRRAQCKGGNGKKIPKMYNPHASLGKHGNNIYMKQKSRNHEQADNPFAVHFPQHLPNYLTFLHLQNIWSLMLRISCGRQRRGYVPNVGQVNLQCKKAKFYY